MDYFIVDKKNIIGKEAHSVFNHHIAQMLEKNYGRCYETAEKLEFEEYFDLPAGKRWFLTTLTPIIRDGKVVQIVGSKKDITEWKQTEKALIEKEQYLRKILETTEDGFWVIGSNGVLVDANEAYCKMTGYTRTELLTMHINDLDAIESSEETQARIKSLIRDGSVLFETRHRRKDGGVLDVEISLSAVSKEPLIMICFCRNITERKEIEKNLIEANKSTEEAYGRSAKNERLLVEAQRMAHIGTYELDFVTGFWTSSEELNTIFGIEPQYNRTIEGLLEIVHPNWREVMRKYLTETISQQRQFDTIFKIVTINEKQERWIHGLGEIIID